VDLGVCVLDQYATDPHCRPGQPALLCATDIAEHCGSDVASVTHLLDAHTKAMVADGIVPPAGK
jgi:hypothetical protein